jgi:hypothetical protein
LLEKHLGDKQAEDYPHLDSYSKNPQEIEKYLKEVDGLSKQLQKRTVGKEREQKQRLDIEKALLELLSLTDQKEEEIQKKLNGLNATLRAQSNRAEKGKTQFQEQLFLDNNVKSCPALFEQSKASQAYQVVESDDPNDFLLMGTEVKGSCQKVEGNPDLNVCLLGYFLDGKHRLLLVKSVDDGTIAAHSVLRLLIDKKGQPVLFMERVYNDGQDTNYASLLKKIALKKAAHLGIPLVCSKADFEKEVDTLYPYEVFAKEKPVPFEYVDALHGKQKGPLWDYEPIPLM